MIITCWILQAEAIRKIRGQDSNKKKQEKIKKQQEELAQVSHVFTIGCNFVNVMKLMIN